MFTQAGFSWVSGHPWAACGMAATGLPRAVGSRHRRLPSVQENTGISQRQQVGFVGGAAGGVLIAAAGASAPWIVGGALIGAGLGTGIATLGNHGQAHGPPSGESFNDFFANPPGAERTWRNPANDDHGTVTIAAETRAADGPL